MEGASIVRRYFSSILLSRAVNFLPSETGWPSAIEARPMRTLDQSFALKSGFSDSSAIFYPRKCRKSLDK